MEPTNKMTRRQNLKKMWEERKKRAKERKGERESVATCFVASAFYHDQPDSAQPSTNYSSPSLPQATSVVTSTPKISAAMKKQDMGFDLGELETEDIGKYMFVEKDAMLEWVSSFARCLCGEDMNVIEEQPKGMVSTFRAVCESCEISGDFTTSRGKSRNTYEVHKQLVKSTLLSGCGFTGATNLFVAFNMTPLTERGYYKIARQVEDEGIEKLECMMQKTRANLHNILRKKGDDNEVKDIYVSCDGSWSKRGFTANYGFVSVIEVTTGYCIDFVVLSKWCKICSNINSQQDPPKHDCTKNFRGSSPAMEVEGWKQLWARSVEKCKFRYLKVVSDGDSKGISAVQELDPYGVEIQKFECVNHVSKRLGTALLNASKNLHLGGKGEGTLTKDKVLRLAHYFGKAIRQETTVEEMKGAIFATLRHCQSTDSKPQHNTCPDGEQSWCFYKRAVANNQPIPSHKTKMHTYLKESVVAKIMPVYMRLASTELLEKCKGDTQNSNESLHSVIWSILPKTKFCSLRRTQYGVYRAVVCFNHGRLAEASLEGNIGTESMKVLNESMKRIKQIGEWKESKKEDIRKRKIRTVLEEEKKKAAEGDTYGSGIAPIP